MAIQTKTGKAFEYAILLEFYNRLKSIIDVSIIENQAFNYAKVCFKEFETVERDAYLLSASQSVNLLIDLEPRLSNSIDKADILQLEIVSDISGEHGDVRDVLMIRSLQKWEIGISAKNNHRAVKHSRLSQKINFGEKWFGIPCTSKYFDEIRPVFSMLSDLKAKDKSLKWDSINNMHDCVYIPILDAFKNELIRLDKQNPESVPTKLVQYLIGCKDFYKVIKSNNKVEIQAYNLFGTLNQAFNHIKAKAKIPKLKLPNRLIEVVYENNSKTTLIVSLNEGWQISFRIHNAKSTIESSLKFDINLISSPHSLFTTHVFLYES